jgi:hypothetical protein
MGDRARCRQALVSCVPGDGQGEQSPGESAGEIVPRPGCASLIATLP